MGSEHSKTADTATTAATDATSAFRTADAAKRASGWTAALTLPDLRFAVLRNGAYHNARQSWFAGLHRTGMFVSGLAGTATVSAALTKLDSAAALAGLVTTIAAMLDLVFGLSERAATHARLRERVYHLMAEVEECGATADSMRKCNASLTRLYGEEPPTMKAVEALAWNAAKAAMTKKLDRNDLLVVPWYWHYPLRHILPFSGTVFQSRNERARRATKD